VNTNIYSNLSYQDFLKNNWKIDAAIAFNYYKDGITRQLFNNKNQQLFLPDYPYNEYNLDSTTQSNFAQARFVLRKQLPHNQAIRFGAEYFYNHDLLSSNDPFADTTSRLVNHLMAVFAERDIRISKGWPKLAPALNIPHS
jgi:hypothetical protein